MSVGKQKAAARARDGNRCVDCGMTSAEHKRHFIRDLHCHRLKPDRGYILKNLATLCDKCHKARHGAKQFAARKPGVKGIRKAATKRCTFTFPDGRLSVRLPLETVAKIADVAQELGISKSSSVRHAINRLHDKALRQS